MHVIATAGHVDHGKSTLVRALTGTDPDRLEEERRRGLTISLGYCWTELPDAGEVAFVDVPGHERFLSTMLSGVGPVPAVLFVVAADDDWMPQATEHLAALEAFGVEHGVVAVTRADLADPGPAARRAAAQLAGTALRGAPIVQVSGRTGQGLPELRQALSRMVAALPVPDPVSDVRLWVDRRFTVRGAGTVVTGTLPAGTVARGDQLAVGDELVRVRGIEALGRSREQISGTARVALNLGSKVPDSLARDSVLVTPGAWHWTTAVDVVLQPTAAGPGRAELTLHVGAVADQLHFRALGESHARLLLRRPLPLRVGDRAILRDPGSRRLWGVVVVDPAPPPIDRRGAARQRAVALENANGDPGADVRRRRLVRASLLRRIGVPADRVDALRAGDWLLDRGAAAELRARLAAAVAARAAEEPLDPAMPITAVARLLEVPAELVPPLVEPPLKVVDGRVVAADAGLPAEVRAGVARLAERLRDEPYRAPEAAELEAAGLDRRSLAAAERAGLLLRLAEGVVLLPGADASAAQLLTGLSQPFTTSAARRCLGSTRRVVVPLLEHLDRTGRTRRLPDDRREVLPK